MHEAKTGKMLLSVQRNALGYIARMPRDKVLDVLTAAGLGAWATDADAELRQALEGAWIFNHPGVRGMIDNLRFSNE